MCGCVSLFFPFEVHEYREPDCYLSFLAIPLIPALGFLILITDIVALRFCLAFF